jgi:hypothetical protein
MERFSYPSLEAVRAESTEILQLLELESYGYKRDELEAQAEREEELAQQKAELNG